MTNSGTLKQNALPPDQQAYAEAWRHAGPQQQLDAFLKMAVDFPQSSWGQGAHITVLELLTKHFPSRTADMRREIDLILKDVKPEAPGLKRLVATLLLNGRVLLPDARRITEQALKDYTEQVYTAESNRQRVEAKLSPQDPAMLRTSYLTNRAALLATLGMVHLKEGSAGAARRQFEEAERVQPHSLAAEGLALLGYNEGREAVAYQYLLRARVTGVPAAENIRLLETLHAKRNGGKLDGLETALDDAYRKHQNNPISHVERFSASSRSNRTALLEVFTGASCPPCAGADLAVSALTERFAPKQLVVLMYHVHIPRADPMANPDSEARAQYYAAPGAPVFVINGTGRAQAGGPRHAAEQSFQRVNPTIEKAVQEPAGAALSVQATLHGDTIDVQSQPLKVKSGVSDLKLRIALVEREVNYSGENGIRLHPMVVRELQVFAVGPASPRAISARFDVKRTSEKLKGYLDEYERTNDRFGPMQFAEKKHVISRSNLSVVAFLQSDTDKQVLQAAFAELRPVTAGSR